MDPSEVLWDLYYIFGGAPWDSAIRNGGICGIYNVQHRMLKDPISFRCSAWDSGKHWNSNILRGIHLISCEIQISGMGPFSDHARDSDILHCILLRSSGIHLVFFLDITARITGFCKDLLGSIWACFAIHLWDPYLFKYFGIVYSTRIALSEIVCQQFMKYFLCIVHMYIVQTVCTYRALLTYCLLLLRKTFL